MKQVHLNESKLLEDILKNLCLINFISNFTGILCTYLFILKFLSKYQKGTFSLVPNLDFH